MIINDPVLGFIEVPGGLLTDLVKHPLMIRLGRICQLGPTAYVYPGAQHTRFQHSVGAFHLVSEALDSLAEKGNCILDREAEGVKVAMLLHDLGHGPMSHTLEGQLIREVSHEELTLRMMERINAEMGGRLDMAIRIFRDEYPKHYLHELICSQLDMDRMDYLCRDSFFAGVREGNIGAARMIKMLNVKDDRLVVESKGVYTIENYLMSRRLMYWQVYLHKTALAAQEVIVMAIRRARELALSGVNVFATPALRPFLYNDVNRAEFERRPDYMESFIQLDDSDVELSMKQWCHADDKVLRLLADDFINRHLYKVREVEQPVTPEALAKMRGEMARVLGVTEAEAAYFVRAREVEQMLYSTSEDHITVRFANDTVRDISEISELLSSELVDKQSRRFFLFYQRCKEQFVPIN